MGELIGLYDYPLTGARARSLDCTQITPGGLIDDRIGVLYEADQAGILQRVSQKQVRKLAQLSSYVDALGTLVIQHREFDGLTIPHDTIRPNQQAADKGEIFVNEFGEDTPAWDCGDEAAEWFQNFTGRDKVRLARKQEYWRMLGRDPQVTKVAPLHIITAQSVRFATDSLRSFINLTDRFRANIVLDVPEYAAKSENDWNAIRIGDVTLKIVRETERCPVPGNDQRTGEKMKDIPRLYPTLPQSSGGKAIFGVYAYAQVESNEEAFLCKGDSVEVL